MFDILESITKSLGEVVAGFRPELVTGADAARLVDVFAGIERLASSGKVLAAGRVDSTGSWSGSGHRSSANWFARRTGTSVGRAIDALATARHLDELPLVEDALRSGRLSEPQAKEVTSAAVCAPEKEAELLEAAEKDSLSGLKETCRKVRAASTDQEAAYRRIHRNRSLRHWSDPDGTFRLDARLTPDAGARLITAVEEEANRFFEEARKEDRFESNAAYQADALVALVTGDRQNAPNATVCVRVDHEAFVRGSTQDGETCEIDGVGPIPVSVARRLANDAFVKVLSTNGTDIHTVSHMGRSISARLRTAIEQRDPTCSVPGCTVRSRLEIDHVIPFAEGGPTELANLARLCAVHHHLKTNDGWVLAGPPGNRTWEPPPGGEPPRRVRARRAPANGRTGRRSSPEPERGSAQRGQPSAGSAQRGQPSAGSAQRGQPSAGSAQRGQPSAGSAQRGQPSAGSAQRGQPSAGSAQRGQPSAGSAQRGQPSAGSAQRGQPSAGSAQRGQPSAGSAQRGQPSAGSAQRGQPSAGSAQRGQPSAGSAQRGQPSAGSAQRGQPSAGSAQRGQPSAGSAQRGMSASNGSAPLQTLLSHLFE